jgi:hypothetical protein
MYHVITDLLMLLVWYWQVLRDFRVPEGRTPEDIDAAGDGEVLAVLDLRPDEALAEAGVAREVGPLLVHLVNVNINSYVFRVQRLGVHLTYWYTWLHPSISPKDGEH